jgi:prolyl oligopeptidase
VFALPNLRGGGEFGEAWHEAGMLDRKQNVFDDFIAAAQWLIVNKYTRPEKLAISGRSNGGLLVGAALTQRPDLFGAVVCGYPLLDMVRYHQFLVAKFWVPEYGSSEDPAQFQTLLAYSPITTSRRGQSTPRCCSSPATPTRGSTRFMRERWRHFCRPRPVRTNRCC